MGALFTFGTRALTGAGPIGAGIGGALMLGQAYWRSLNADEAERLAAAVLADVQAALAQLITGPQLNELRRLDMRREIGPIIGRRTEGMSPANAAAFFQHILEEIRRITPDLENNRGGRQDPPPVLEILKKLEENLKLLIEKLGDSFNFWWGLKW